MIASVADLAELRQEELGAMAWHPIESLQQHCCIKVEMLKNGQQQNEPTEQLTALCNQRAACILCAGFAHLGKTMKKAYLEAEKNQIYIGRGSERSAVPVTIHRRQHNVAGFLYHCDAVLSQRKAHKEQLIASRCTGLAASRNTGVGGLTWPGALIHLGRDLLYANVRTPAFHGAGHKRHGQLVVWSMAH